MWLRGAASLPVPVTGLPALCWRVTSQDSVATHLGLLHSHHFSQQRGRWKVHVQFVVLEVRRVGEALWPLLETYCRELVFPCVLTQRVDLWTPGNIPQRLKCRPVSHL